MDIRKIKKLIEMLQESDLKEIEVSQGDESVRISRNNSSHQEFISKPVIVKNDSVSSSETHQSNQVTQPITGNAVTSPIVGTFYRSPSPEKDPFVKVGDSVQIGDVLCIVEAMKMMNEIKSEFDGKVASIDVEDGSPVEFGQTIITVN
jgi:acetyl-CoA carboxylase biotin carboxyl carrier protein|tara:strand:- start:193 stop:636 length:444 start_codon:yes stop_codon:yes gene_type:complete